MSQSALREFLDRLRQTWATQAARDLTDSELLRRYAVEGEHAAFTVLVQRHGPMVLGVGRRVLLDSHAAEDVFQATFMVLARRAGSIGRRRPLGGWLYAVAQRIASKARAQTATRRERERRFAQMPQREELDEVALAELRSVLDEEMACLSDKHRVPLVLCYLQGKSHEQAAFELHWHKTTFTRRLARGRELLRERLVRRGITLSAASMAAALVDTAAAAPVATVLTLNTVKIATSAAGGKMLAIAGFSPRALAWAEAAMRGVVGIKIKILVLVLLLALGAGSVGLGGLGAWSDPSQPADAEQAKGPAKADPGVGIKTLLQIRTDLFWRPAPVGCHCTHGNDAFSAW